VTIRRTMPDFAPKTIPVAMEGGASRS